ncbi:hypothetical protein ACFV1N_44770 [Streptosporangium canum]|uniref:hypothetical protein n=1 Tax=Streptosporangium canum TaxID=324952 RepID=UPI00367DB3D2
MPAGSVADRVDLSRPVEVVGKPEVLPGTVQIRSHDDGVGAVGELAVSGDVIPMGVGVQDEQRVAVPGMAGQPASD